MKECGVGQRAGRRGATRSRRSASVRTARARGRQWRIGKGVEERGEMDPETCPRNRSARNRCRGEMQPSVGLQKLRRSERNATGMQRRRGTQILERRRRRDGAGGSLREAHRTGRSGNHRRATEMTGSQAAAVTGPQRDLLKRNRCRGGMCGSSGRSPPKRGRRRPFRRALPVALGATESRAAAVTGVKRAAERTRSRRGSRRRERRKRGRRRPSQVRHPSRHMSAPGTRRHRRHWAS